MKPRFYKQEGDHYIGPANTVPGVDGPVNADDYNGEQLLDGWQLLSFDPNSALWVVWNYAPNQIGLEHFHNPQGLNYKTGLTRRLHPVDTIVRGELVSRVYYADRVEDEYITPVVRESTTYVRDDSGNAISRTMIIEWMSDQDQWGFAKSMVKFYDTPRSQIVEGQKRRQNVINDLRGRGVGTQIEQYINAFFAKHDKLIALYIETGSDAFEKAVAVDDEQWLDVPIPTDDGNVTSRFTIIDELTFGKGGK